MPGTLAFASAISFPDRLDHLLDDLEDNLGSGARFDAELLYRRSLVSWSAPSWCRPGDVCFFYCTTNWPMRIRRLKSRTIENSRWKIDGQLAKEADHAELDNLLRSAHDLHGRIGGRIFAIGEVSTLPEQRQAARKRDRIKSRVFTDIHRVIVIEPALSRELATQHIAPRPRATITHIEAKAATALVNEIHEKFAAPMWLQAKRFGRTEIVEITPQNWKSHVADEDFRALNESELREAMIDNLASTLSEEDCWHAECGCSAETRSCGVADYMIPFSGKWLPIEAKLRMAGCDEAVEQMRQYLRTVRFSPRKGATRGQTFSGRVHPVGLIVDSDGIYAADERGLFECAPGRPLIPRSALARYSDSELRRRILELEKT